MSDMDPRAHLGIGWAFPLRPVDGRLRFAHYEEDIDQAVEIILRTMQGERPMLPAFGAGLQRQVFQPNSAPTHRAVEQAVTRALDDWEPRIRLERVEATVDEDDANVLLVAIDYVVRATNSFYNRVFPFYLVESGA